MARNAETLVSVVAVVADEHEVVAGFIEETTQVLTDRYAYYELLLVDNGSGDGCAAQLQALLHRVPNLRLLRLSRRYDQETAVAAGLDNSLGDYVVIMDMRYDPPAMLPQLLDRALEGYDVVTARRTRRDDEDWVYRGLATVFYRVASVALGCELQPQASDFRVFSRQVVNSLSRIRNKHRYLKHLVAVVGFRYTEVPYERVWRCRPRRPTWGFVRSTAAAVDVLISNSAAPLRWAALLGILASLLNLMYVGYILGVTLVKKHIAEGWLTTNLTHTVMFLLLFVILSILSEYVARILEEIKERPLYFVESEVTSTVLSFKREALEGRLNVV